MPNTVNPVEPPIQSLVPSLTGHWRQPRHVGRDPALLGQV